ncbi:ATP-binding cassette domain-containing protein [Porphyromonas somerae]|uniref:ATP-binding cassette domain-containing protein n=1 Tax=Porphyromonas somerae TaxID=322095 RepID=UPI002A805494|nr:ATP-binding cassette domain-containing protein [Porphyromonas somerae]MDY3884874.1 ATP-binding cassette domain-containing protein [Porphyromonas somerae]
MRLYDQAKKAFIPQDDQNECGAICLLIIIRFFSGNNRITTIKDLTNTSLGGCTLLDIYTAANKLGMNSSAFQLQDNDLSSLNYGIVQVITKEGFPHFCVFFGFKNDRVILGDPAKGVVTMSQNEFLDMWKSRIILEISPKEEFFEINNICKNYNLNNIISAFSPYAGAFYSIILLSLIASIISLISPVFSKVLIDTILPLHKMSILVLTVLCVSSCLSIGVFVNYALQSMVVCVTSKYTFSIANSLLDSLLSLSKKSQGSYSFGDVISRFREVDNSGYVFSLMSSFVNSIFFFFLSSIVIAFFSTELMVVTIVATITYFILSIVFTRKYLLLEKNRLVSLSKYYATLGSYLNNLDHLRYSSFYNSECSVFQRKKSSLSDYVVISKYQINLSTVFLLINIVYVSLSLIIASHLYFDGKIALGSLVALFSYTSMLYPHIQNLFSTIPILVKTYQALNRAFEFKEDLSLPTDAHNLVSNITSIKANKLTLSLQQGKNLFEDIQFEITKGECLIIQGSNGSGKSTLLHLLLGGYNNYQGTIKYNDIEISHISKSSLWQKIGVVLQNATLIEGSIKENIVFGEEYDSQWLCYLIEKLMFKEFFSRFSMGLDTLINGENGRLSLGEIKIILLLRALYKKPEVLILDELLSSVDEIHSRQMLSVIHKISSHLILIVVTHSPQKFASLNCKYILIGKE